MLILLQFFYSFIETNPQSTLKGEAYEDRNRRLNRPLSPHLSIHKLQNNMLMSISHRAAGFILSSVLSGFAIGKSIY